MSRRREDTAEMTITRRLAREAESAVVSLTRDDGQRFTVVGRGVSLPQRYTNALAQLPPGTYRVECVSTPTTIYGDLRGRDTIGGDHRTRSKRPLTLYEYQRVVIA
jgi:hypothetical protein